MRELQTEFACGLEDFGTQRQTLAGKVSDRKKVEVSKEIKRNLIMNNTNDGITIKTLFADTSICFEIPRYQRSYSWGKSQWGQFVSDLKDAETGYYLGHYLFEKTGDKLLVIDGQQRLTTCVIFMRSAIDVLEKKDASPKDVRVWKKRYLLEEDYGARLRTVPYDDPVFQDCVIYGRKVVNDVRTQSARNILDAKDYFKKELLALDVECIRDLIGRMENASITTYNVVDRAMAARIFAFQNDRGKDLTKLEIIKSFLMLTVYLKSGSEQIKEQTLSAIDMRFASIYEEIMRVDVDEDLVLSYYWKSRKGYGADNVVDEIKRELKKDDDPIEWIQTFVRELTETFVFVERFMLNRDEYYLRLKQLNNLALAFPLMLRATLRGVRTDSDIFQKLLMLIENITMRSLIRGGRADVLTRLTPHLLKIESESTLLCEMEGIVEAIGKGWWGYWSDSEFERCLSGWFFGNRVDNYLLWQYELSLYGRGYAAPVAVTADEMMRAESIEHIAPQTLSSNNERVNGYGQYADSINPENGIVTGGWMNCIGNLMLASQSQNSSLGNKPFTDKLEDYKKCILMQQQKIREYASYDDAGNVVWSVDSIRKRHNDIVAWAKARWDVSKILE